MQENELLKRSDLEKGSGKSVGMELLSPSLLFSHLCVKARAESSRRSD